MNVLSTNQENELILRVSGGDEEAFARIFEHYHHSLGMYIYTITKSEQVAEEIVQDTFLKIWMSRETLAEIKNFKAYMFTISRNAAISALRKAVKEHARRAEWQQVRLLADNDEGPQKEERLCLIDQAIEALHPQRKRVYVLFRQKGWSCEQVARELGISKLTVRSHIQQATAAITKYVKNQANTTIALAWTLFNLF